VGVHDQARDFVIFVGNDGLVKELLERDVGKGDPRGHHLLGALGGDPGKAVTGARRRGFGQEIAKVVEDIARVTDGVPIDHIQPTWNPCN